VANGSAPAESTSTNQPPITVDYWISKPDLTRSEPYSITLDDGASPMTMDSDEHALSYTRRF